MTAAIALSLLAQVPQAPPARLPFGATPAFAQAALAVDARLAAGDAAGAREALRALPSRTPRLAWSDDAALPATLREARAARLARVVAEWAKGVRGFAPQVIGDAPDLSVGFAPTLPEGADGLPAPVQVSPGTPYRATIGLNRGKPGKSIDADEFGSAVAYALGAYLGVSDSPFPLTAMHQESMPGMVAYMPQGFDEAIAQKNLELVDRLRDAVETGKPLGLAAPSLGLPLKVLDLGEKEQGARLHGSFLIENKGAGPLEYLIRPDCSCFTIPRSVPIPAGKSTVVNFEVNTTSYVGQIDKVLLLLTNDPAHPTTELPVTFRATPAYRLFHPGGDRVMVSETGGTYDIFLFVPPGSNVHPTDARWDGEVDAKLTWSEWEGPLADPEMQEGALYRKGWRFRVRIPASLRPGHISTGTLTVTTDSPQFGTLITSLIAQKGIAAEPESVYLGLVKPGTQASFLVRRPKAPFKILGVDAGVLKATWHEVQGGMIYRIDLTYEGGAPTGDLLVPVKVRTDDPQHPLVEALASGTVR